MRRTNRIWLSIAFIMLLSPNAFAQVMTGLDVFVQSHFAALKGKRVGLITNKTGLTRSGEFGPHLFAQQKSFALVALYSPEHGLMGERQAGVASDAQEQFEGVPVNSLYGSTRKPTKAMLKGVNTLVFDIQDVGVRPYTYLSTMILSMEAAAENKIAYVVLDRPNPLSGDRVEGNLLDTSLRSFVGQVPVPYLHGMTLGELAKMAKAKGWFHSAAKLKLSVIAMKGWKRSMYWSATGLTWTAPSPNVPHFENAVGLAMLGATGELGILSIGIGTDKPFLRVGSNLIAADALSQASRSAFAPSIALESGEYVATTSGGTKSYNGVSITLPADLASIPNLYDQQYRLLSELSKTQLFQSSLDQLPKSVHVMYEKVTGTHGVLDALRNSNVEAMIGNWDRQAASFRWARKPYLLY